MIRRRQGGCRGRLLAVLVMGLAVGGVAAGAETTLRIATYNLANYNLTDRQIEGAFLTQYPKPETEKQALRRVLHALDADVLALQELGGEVFLRELQRDLRGEGRDYPHGVVLEASDPDRRVAVLSRVPLAAVRRHTDLDFKYFEGRERIKRGLLEVRLALPGGDLTLFVVHLKSRWTERRDDPGSALRRDREATAARDRVLERFPDPAAAWFVIAGDFNAGPADRGVQAFLARGPREISRLVPATDSRGETWTHRYRRNDAYSRVDHLLVSPALWPRVRGEARIVDGPEVNRASDHRPVVMELTWPEGEAAVSGPKPE